ncbi:hypothetical protein U0070_007864 [Myodes glareolus]|uniref:Uncharacterized protein n=1 Tax=Myodes glareolus TaxID=447135 RepID=A0AAW0IQ44_MYOGA
MGYDSPVLSIYGYSVTLSEVEMCPSQGLSDKRRGCSHLQGCAALIQQIKPLLQVLHAGKEITADNQDKAIIDCGSWTTADNQGKAIIDCGSWTTADSQDKTVGHGQWQSPVLCGNLASVARLFPTYAVNLAFRDKYKQISLGDVEPRANSGHCFAGNLASEWPSDWGNLTQHPPESPEQTVKGTREEVNPAGAGMVKDSCKTAFDRRVHSAAGHLPEPYSSQSIPEVLVTDLMYLNKFYSEKPETQNADLITEEAAVGEGVAGFHDIALVGLSLTELRLSLPSEYHFSSLNSLKLRKLRLGNLVSYSTGAQQFTATTALIEDCLVFVEKTLEEREEIEVGNTEGLRMSNPILINGIHSTQKGIPHQGKIGICMVPRKNKKKPGKKRKLGISRDHNGGQNWGHWTIESYMSVFSPVFPTYLSSALSQAKAVSLFINGNHSTQRGPHNSQGAGKCSGNEGNVREITVDNCEAGVTSA